MKRFRIAVLSIAVLLPVCLSQASEEKPAPPLPTASSPQAGGEEAALGIDQALIQSARTYRCTGDLDGMLKRRIVRLLVVNSRTFYFLDGSVQRGVIYDYAEQFEAFLNKKLKTGKLPVDFLYIPVRRDELLPYLVEGRGDIAAADLTITPARQKIADFSTPINVGQGFSELVVTGPDAPSLASIEDLAGREVFVRGSSSYCNTLNEWNERFRKEGRAPMVVKTADENLEDEDILELVNAGVVGITVVDSYLAEFWKDIFDQILVREDLVLKTGDHVGWAVRKGNPELLQILSGFIGTHTVTSASANPILRRYLVENRWVKNPASKEERRKFHQMIDLFKTYGSMYDLNYLLVAAQAYQESGLDQSARSRSGAVGVMQIKPATAAAAPINIRNVEILENNIHAGVKYMRFFIDDYFSEEELTPLDKALFAFASYNAGPGRISSLRRKAAAQQLDPNKWFDNVELVAARQIGRETVRYVRNIFKCFVAYQLLHEREREREEARSREKSGGGK